MYSPSLSSCFLYYYFTCVHYPDVIRHPFSYPPKSYLAYSFHSSLHDWEFGFHSCYQAPSFWTTGVSTQALYTFLFRQITISRKGCPFCYDSLWISLFDSRDPSKLIIPPFPCFVHLFLSGMVLSAVQTVPLSCWYSFPLIYLPRSSVNLRCLRFSLSKLYLASQIRSLCVGVWCEQFGCNWIVLMYLFLNFDVLGVLIERYCHCDVLTDIF